MMQQAGSNKLKKYSYEYTRFVYLKNMEKYGSFSPPVYDVSKNLVPTAAFYGDNDLLTTGRVSY